MDNVHDTHRAEHGDDRAWSMASGRHPYCDGCIYQISVGDDGLLVCDCVADECRRYLARQQDKRGAKDVSYE